MKSKLAILLTILILPLLMVTTDVKAEDGSGLSYTSQSTQETVVDAFGFPPYGTLRTFRFCAVDGFGGLWNLTAANGTITGTRNNINDCVWNIDGNYKGPNFHMNLTLTAGGTTCCTSGFTDGTASRRSRSAVGDTFWTGSCNSGPWAYSWTQCP